MSIETILKLSVAAAVLVAIGVARLGFLAGRRIVGRMRTGEWPETGPYRQRAGAFRERTGHAVGSLGAVLAVLGRALAASIQRTAVIVARLGHRGGETAATTTKAFAGFDRRAGKTFAVWIVRVDNKIATRLEATAPATRKISALLQRVWTLAAFIMATGARWSSVLWSRRFLPGLEQLGASAKDPGSGEIPSDLGPLGPPVLR